MLPEPPVSIPADLDGQVIELLVVPYSGEGSGVVVHVVDDGGPLGLLLELGDVRRLIYELQVSYTRGRQIVADQAAREFAHA